MGYQNYSIDVSQLHPQSHTIILLCSYLMYSTLVFVSVILSNHAIANWKLTFYKNTMKLLILLMTTKSLKNLKSEHLLTPQWKR